MISFVTLIIDTYKFGGKCYLSLLVNYYVIKEVICKNKYKKYNLK